MNHHLHYKKILLLFVLIPGMQLIVNAHTINYALQNAPVHEVAWYYFKLGFVHIIPQGLDHVLFIIGICLINAKLKLIVYQATAFTLAHTIALALSMKNIIVAPAPIVEPIIALSIIFVAVENLILKESKPWRLLLVFLFGLIHGLGFASALNEVGLPPNQFFTSILLFNLGIEICQVLIIAALFFLIIRPFKQKTWYRSHIVFPVSILIAVVSSFWVVERLTG